MTHVSCRLTAKNRDQLRNPTLGNRVWAFKGPPSVPPGDSLRVSFESFGVHCSSRCSGVGPQQAGSVAWFIGRAQLSTCVTGQPRRVGLPSEERRHALGALRRHGRQPEPRRQVPHRLRSVVVRLRSANQPPERHRRRRLSVLFPDRQRNAEIRLRSVHQRYSILSLPRTCKAGS